ncbi:MAG: selenide,water dikinase [Gammaproteobacteria bacterium]|jgi:selenide,water dikinase
MKTDNTPIVKDLVLIGGGHSHVIVLKRFAMKPLPGVRITLICRDVETPYSGMLPGLVAGHYTHDDVHIDLGPLARFANARFYNDEAIGLDLAARTVHTRKRPPVPYDVLSIDIGSTPYMADVPGAAENVVAVKPISNFFDRWQELVQRVETSQGPLSIAIVGAGAGGTEMLLAMQYGLQRRLRDLGHDPARLNFHLFVADGVPLPTHAPKVQQAFLRVCRERDINVHLNASVRSVDGKRLKTSDGATHEIDETLWVTRASAQSWLGDSGLKIHGNGFIAVNATLESISHPGVFGAGDCAAVLAHPREKAGVFAVRQGPALERNLRRALRARALKNFVPQKKFLGLISTGDRYAVATRGGSLMLEGAWVWRWKDWIDRGFMRKFSDLPEMNSDEGVHLATGLADTQALKELSVVAMRCGGCGAKVGANVLASVMNDLKPAARADVLIGLHEPDDAAVISVPANKLVVQSVDSFRAMIDDPYLFGKIAANHALGDIFAMGAEPQSALAIATLPYGIESKVEDTLRQMMSGAMEILADANAALVGGHTSEGAELSLGFALSGLIDADAILRKGGMGAGDVLIISKPIGTGTLFAADMRHKARGRWITAAIDSMVQSNRGAAQCLFEHHATSCTDVTGFGLLGHLVEMVKASAVDVTLNLQAVPYMDGALETVAMGITSSLQPQNLRLRRAIKNLAAVTADPRYPLLFDPQTAGGLLASVPQDQAVDCVQALKALGYEHSAVIGRVLAQSDALEPITLIV